MISSRSTAIRFVLSRFRSPCRYNKIQWICLFRFLSSLIQTITKRWTQSSICLTMTNKELFYFTGKCLMLDENPLFREEIIALNALGTIDWLRFSATCSDHLILPVIYLKFQKQGLLDYLPEEFSDHLKYIYDLNRERNTRILVQLHSITTILNKNDICPVFLKGSAHLLDGLYSDIGE